MRGSPTIRIKIALALAFALCALMFTARPALAGAGAELPGQVDVPKWTPPPPPPPPPPEPPPSRYVPPVDRYVPPPSGGGYTPPVVIDPPRRWDPPVTTYVEPPKPDPPGPTIIYRDVYNTVTNTVTDKRNVVTGYAAKSLGNFMKNDWDTKSGYTNPSQITANLSKSETKFLSSVSGLKAQTTYFIDTTGKSVSTSKPQNYSTTTNNGTSTSQSTQVVGNTIIITNTHTTTVTKTNVVYKTVAKAFDYSPLVLDVDRDSKIDTARNEWTPHAPKMYTEYAAMFDISGDGAEDFTEWIAPRASDALLVMPEGGKVENANQLFGTAGGYVNGFDKLAVVCDKNHNGWVEGAELEGLFLWTDANNDAKCQPEELKTLKQAGVTRLSTAQSNFVGKYTTADGKTHTMWDWWPAAVEVRKFHLGATEP